MAELVNKIKRDISNQGVQPGDIVIINSPAFGDLVAVAFVCEGEDHEYLMLRHPDDGLRWNNEKFLIGTPANRIPLGSGQLVRHIPSYRVRITVEEIDG